MFSNNCCSELIYFAAIRGEIQDIEDGKMDIKVNPLKVRSKVKYMTCIFF